MGLFSFFIAQNCCSQNDEHYTALDIQLFELVKKGKNIDSIEYLNCIYRVKLVKAINQPYYNFCEFDSVSVQILPSKNRKTITINSVNNNKGLRLNSADSVNPCAAEAYKFRPNNYLYINIQTVNNDYIHFKVELATDAPYNKFRQRFYNTLPINKPFEILFFPSSRKKTFYIKTDFTELQKLMGTFFSYRFALLSNIFPENKGFIW